MSERIQSLQRDQKPSLGRDGGKSARLKISAELTQA